MKKILIAFIFWGSVVGAVSWCTPDNGRFSTDLDLGTKGNIER